MPKNVNRDYNTILRKQFDVATADSDGEIYQNLTDDPSATGDWSSLASLFDSYRVNSITLSWVPLRTFNGTVNYPPLAIIYDSDSTSLPALGTVTLDYLLQYGNCKIMSTADEFTVKALIPRRTSLRKANNDPTVVQEGGFIDIADVSPTSVMAWYAHGATGDFAYATVIAHWDVTFRARR